MMSLGTALPQPIAPFAQARISYLQARYQPVVAYLGSCDGRVVPPTSQATKSCKAGDGRRDGGRTRPLPVVSYLRSSESIHLGTRSAFSLRCNCLEVPTPAQPAIHSSPTFEIISHPVYPLEHLRSTDMSDLTTPVASACQTLIFICLVTPSAALPSGSFTWTSEYRANRLGNGRKGWHQRRDGRPGYRYHLASPWLLHYSSEVIPVYSALFRGQAHVAQHY